MPSVVVVTGTSSGLGRATALAFARSGRRVLAGIRNPADAPALRALHEAIEPIVIDMADAASIEIAASEIGVRSGAQGLSALVNVAGYTFYGPIEYAAPSEVQRLFQVLTFGPTALANALLPALRRAAHGGARSKILNVISWAAIDATPFAGYYAAAKAALLRLTQAQTYELTGFGIDAAAIVPGLMKTPFVGRAPAQIGTTLKALPPEGVRDYGAYLRRMADLGRSAQHSALAAAPEVVAQRIVAIADKQRLRGQYDIGIDTRLVRIMNQTLPFCILRKIKASLLGLEAKPSPAS
jgi:NAD(P)-dependent dehydrogenase (short-subunit alcohol dehydrogenase family)